MKVLAPFYPQYTSTPDKEAFTLTAEALQAPILTVKDHSPFRLLRELWGEQVQAHGRGKPFPELTSLFARQTIYDFHNNFIGQGRLATMVRRWLFNRCVGVIVHSEFARQNYIRQGIKPQKLGLVPIPVDFDYFSKPGDARRFRQKYGLGDTPFAMCVGFRSHKNPDIMIEACHEVGIRLLMVGFKDAKETGIWGREYLPDAALLQKASSQLIFPGYLPTEDLRDAFAAASVYLNSSQEDGECFCIAVYEAASAGTPLCVPNNGTFDRLKGGALFHPARDSQRLAENIRAILMDSALRERLTDRARKVAEECNYPKALEMYKAFYREKGFLTS